MGPCTDCSVISLLHTCKLHEVDMLRCVNGEADIPLLGSRRVWQLIWWSPSTLRMRGVVSSMQHLLILLVAAPWSVRSAISCCENHPHYPIIYLLEA
jgi:hypothetical protein